MASITASDSSETSDQDILSRVARRYQSLVPHEAKVLVATSGGADSTALLCMIHCLQRQLAISRLGVLHVNHGLRGKESDNDESFVADLAERLNLPLFAKKFSGKSLNSSGMEAWARQERYKFFLETKKREGYDFIATGHTADDQAETVLLRILRGAGVRGLRGILAKRDDSVIRPLMHLRRNEIIAWIESQSIGYRNDASNDDCTFRRNRIRHELLPALEKQEPGATNRLVRIGEAAAQVWSRMQPEVNRWIEKYAKSSGDGFAVAKEGFGDELHAPEAMVRLFQEHDIPADARHIEEVIGNRKRTTGEFLLPGGEWRYYPDQQSIIFTKSHEASGPPFKAVIVVPGITECPSLGCWFQVGEIELPAGEFPRDNLTVHLDRDRCGIRLTYRSVRPDDRFFPLGTDRMMDLGSFLSKQKISLRARSRLGVVEGKGGLIVWIPGIRISEEVKVTSKTRSILKIFYHSGSGGV